jgi:hypothetical protein
MRETVARPKRLTRKSFFVDAKAIREAQKALGVSTQAEAVRVSVDRVLEMLVFWRFMAEQRKALKPGSIEVP